MTTCNVLATARLRGEQGREREAAEAWAFELTYYFLRRVGEQPKVTYKDGVYTVTGLMTTSFPGDGDHQHIVFDATAEPWDLDYVRSPQRRSFLRETYPGARWGGTGAELWDPTDRFHFDPTHGEGAHSYYVD